MVLLCEHSLAAELSKHKRARELKKSQKLELDSKDLMPASNEGACSVSNTTVTEVIKVDSDNESSHSNTPVSVPKNSDAVNLAETVTKVPRLNG